MKVSINDKVFNCEIADTEESRAQGLQFRDEPGPPILFIFDSPEDVSFHMHNVRFPTDMIFLDENKNILKVYEASPEEENIECSNVKYVLEAQDSGVKLGDSVMFNEKVAKIASEILKEAQKGSVIVVDDNGKTLAAFDKISDAKKFMKTPDAKNADTIAIGSKSTWVNLEPDGKLFDCRIDGKYYSWGVWISKGEHHEKLS